MEGFRQIALLVSVGVCALAPAAAASAPPYPWPVKPFDRQHPIIGNFGDPRTAFNLPFAQDGLDGPGHFSFHNGVDIAAPGGTPVYPVASGRVDVASATALRVRATRGRIFQYFHIDTVVDQGQFVRARKTVLGYVEPWAKHVHFSELSGGRARDPLTHGHLTPYADHTKPAITALEFRDAARKKVDPHAISGQFDVVADAFDTPPLRVAGSLPTPVTPAAITWSVTQAATGLVEIGEHAGFDFRPYLPSNADFWTVYARGTYQNGPSFAGHVRQRMRGRYRFRLAPDLVDSTYLPNGGYVLNVTAHDERGNVSPTQRVPFTVANPSAPIARVAAR
jgi:Peptidase family M23